MNLIKNRTKLLTQDSSKIMFMKNIICILFLTCFSLISAQEQSSKTAEKKYMEYSYIDAIKIYEKVAQSGFSSIELFQKIGDSYYFNGLLDKSKIWYDKLFQLDTNLIDSEYYFRYAQSLKSVKDYNEADKMMEKFYELTNDYRGQLYVKNKLYLSEINNNIEKYTIVNAEINSEFSDYSGNFNNNMFYFVSNRPTNKVKNKLDKWTNQNFSNIFKAALKDSTLVMMTNSFDDVLNTAYHESSPVFTNDGKTMYFTRSNFNNGKLGMNKDNIVKLKIYKSTFLDGKWGNITELPFNNKDYNFAHPALSTNEDYLYFASDMPGGFGSSDLYKVAINSDNTFGKPVNLGDKINTKSRETFPFVASDGSLYFSSDGLIGLGGLDIFKSTMDENGNYSNFTNFGAPINSEKDDFSFTEGYQSGTFYFSSNRDGGKGFDDIYLAKLNNKKKLNVISSTLVDQISKLPLPNSKVTLLDANQNFIFETTTDSLGNFTFNDINQEREYFIKAESNTYLTKELRIKGMDVDKLVFEISPSIIKAKPGDDLVKLLNIIIYFNLDDYFIRPDAEVELAKIVELLKLYPNLKIDIRSHTDSRQSASYNVRLSNFRANATKKYLINKGISPDRLTAKGYGESQLVNDCYDSVPCTIEQHQKNRRSEFIIVN